MRVPAKPITRSTGCRSPVPGMAIAPERDVAGQPLLRRLLVLRQVALRLPDRLAGELDAVSVVDEAVADGVGDSLVADDAVPLLGLELAGDDGRRDAVPVLDHLEEIRPLRSP